LITTQNIISNKYFYLHCSRFNKRKSTSVELYSWKLYNEFSIRKIWHSRIVLSKNQSSIWL